MVLKTPIGLRGYAMLPYIIFSYFGTEYIIVSRLKQYHQYVTVCGQKHTNATLTLWGFGYLGNVHVYR